MDIKEGVKNCTLCNKSSKYLFNLGNQRVCDDCFVKFYKSPNKIVATEKPINAPSKSQIATPNYVNYYELLLQQLDKTTTNRELLSYLPKFYLILSKIITDHKADWYSKMLANCALSYLVIESDIIPDNSATDLGYMDDLFICAYVLRNIRDNVSRDIILSNVEDKKEKESIFDDIYNVLSQCDEYVGDKKDRILSFVGLKEFDSLDFTYSEEKSLSINLRKKKQRLIYAMLAVKLSPLLNNHYTDRKHVNFKEYILEHRDLLELKRYMEFDK